MSTHEENLQLCAQDIEICRLSQIENNAIETGQAYFILTNICAGLGQVALRNDNGNRLIQGVGVMCNLYALGSASMVALSAYTALKDHFSANRIRHKILQSQ